MPASAAVAVEVDLILPPGTVPKRVTHEIACYTPVRTVDFDTSAADHLVITADSRTVRRAYPLYGSILDFPESVAP